MIPSSCAGDDIVGQQNAPSEVFGYLSRHIISLYAVHRGVFIGILLLYFLVVALDQRQNLRVRRVGFSHESAGIAIGYVFACKDESFDLHKTIFDHILYFLDVDRAAHAHAFLRNAVCQRTNLLVGNPGNLVDLFVRLLHRVDNLLLVKRRLLPASFNNLHNLHLLFVYFSVQNSHTISCM